jgi:hypothetical protein
MELNVMFQRIWIKNYEMLFKYIFFPYARHDTKWVSTAIQPLITTIDPQCMWMHSFTPRNDFCVKYLQAPIE